MSNRLSVFQLQYHRNPLFALTTVGAKERNRSSLELQLWCSSVLRFKYIFLGFINISAWLSMHKIATEKAAMAL